jgi:hypothetical protein
MWCGTMLDTLLVFLLLLGAFAIPAALVVWVIGKIVGPISGLQRK